MRGVVKLARRATEKRGAMVNASGWEKAILEESASRVPNLQFRAEAGFVKQVATCAHGARGAVVTASWMELSAYQQAQLIR